MFEEDGLFTPCHSDMQGTEGVKFNLRTSVYCKVRLVANMVPVELRTKSTGIIHNQLIMQWDGKFVIPSKESDEHIKLNLRTSVYCTIRLIANMVQVELRNKSTRIIHNELIMQWEG